MPIFLMYHYIRSSLLSFRKGSVSYPFEIFCSDICSKKYNFSKFSLKNLFSGDDFHCKSNFYLSFDDGLKEHFECAKFLYLNNLNGIFFIPTAPILDHKFLDVHKIHLIIELLDSDFIINFISSKISVNKFDFLYKIDATRYDSTNISVIKDLLQWKLSLSERKFIINELFSLISDKRIDTNINNFYLSFNNLKEMLNMEMIIGFHGHSHLRLEKINEKLLNFELERNLEIAEMLSINRNDLIFGYPYGTTSDKVITALKRFGFKYAFTDQPGKISQDLDLFRIPRLDCRYNELGININN